LGVEDISAPESGPTRSNPAEGCEQDQYEAET